MTIVNSDGSPADGTVPVRMAFPDGGVFTATETIAYYAGADAYGPYRGNIEWNGTAADDQVVAFDPSLPHLAR